MHTTRCVSTSLLATLLLCTGCGWGLQGQAAADPWMIRQSETTLRICLPLSLAQYRGVARGSVRLRLSIVRTSHSNIYSPSFSLYLLDARHQRKLVEQFSMHVDMQSINNAKPDPQHFLFDLRDHLPQANSESTLCLELDQQTAAASDTQNRTNPPDAFTVSATWQPIDE